MVLRIEILLQGRGSARSRHVVGDGRYVAGLLKAGDDLLPYRLAARIDVVQVYRRGVRRAGLPEMPDRARQQPQHAADALERLQRRGLRGQRLQDLGVQRIACPKALGSLRTARVVRDGIAFRGPHGLIGGDGFPCGGIVDGLEQAPAQHLRRLVLLGRIEQRRLARRYALGLRHPIGDELVLRRVGVDRPALFADRQRVDQRCARRPLHGLEERRQERGQLLAGRTALLHLAEVHRKLVEQDERRLAAEQLSQRVGAR